MVNAGELEGTVYLKDNRGNESLGAYLDINLHDSEGNLVSSTETEFDGYYLFTDLVPGDYLVSVSVADIKRKNLHDGDPLAFNFSAQGDVIAGADFILQRYTFVKGYVVELGEFDSLLGLKAYWQLIKAEYDNALQQQVFYIFDKESDKYQLNGAFFQKEKQAQRACSYLSQKEIQCRSLRFEFNL